jgi:putative ABC transport system permease protein
LRKALVVFQFAISIGLIVCVGIVFRQMRFLQNVDLGYDRENIVMIPADNVVKRDWQKFKQRLINSPHILYATLSKRAPTGRLLDAPGFSTEVYGERRQSNIFMPHNRVEHDFFKTYGMEIVAGRNFSIEHSTDAAEAFILNETAVERLGWKKVEDAVGQPMSVFGGRKGTIIGVVADFNYESLHSEIVPIVSYLVIPQANTLSIRVAAGKIQEALGHAKGVWSELHPESAFQYDFLDDRIAGLYRNEMRMMQMFGYFSLFAIFIASLGLFGLASFTAEQRTKEMGVRKVLGASVSNIALLLSKDFTKWVLVANIIAWPTAYFLMNRWLNNFAYRINVGWMEFVFAGVLTFMIALSTVSYQSLKAGLANPIDSLRYE